MILRDSGLRAMAPLVPFKSWNKETEAAYLNDWNLLELFFSNCGDNCVTLLSCDVGIHLKKA